METIYKCIVSIVSKRPYICRPKEMATTDKDSMDPKGERGKCLVVEAAKVFWTYGIKSMTMDDMSARLGISKKTLYQHV
ncbi:MAG: TetR/AcrR family transcriptional regulator, partial [Flavobacteriales bacterium]